MIFKDRKVAGRLLAEKLQQKFPQIKNGIILALPRGGVVVAAEISKALNQPLDIIVTRKIGAPSNPEYAVAAVSKHEIVLNPSGDINKQYLKCETAKERQEISRRQKVYRGKKPKTNLSGKTVFLVDDGLATGLTMEVAIREVKHQNPAKIIVAVPVAPPEVIEKFRQKVTDIIVLSIEPMFFAVGGFYENFDQTRDQEVIELLK